MSGHQHAGSDETRELEAWTPTRIRALRWPVLPTLPALSQLAGGASALVGVYLQWGWAVTLIVGGVASVALGALREAKKI
jgi:hypothetical protein